MIKNLLNNIKNLEIFNTRIKTKFETVPAKEVELILKAFTSNNYEIWNKYNALLTKFTLK